ncbi:MAG: hypothetical protein A2X49_12165 [Lentisphaerae bacterium GWF2_52_8]|nr:MAG: hypothetical protein A2X49_12165 [Lentisphaerae bacterium GWF2_52_8]
MELEVIGFHEEIGLIMSVCSPNKKWWSRAERVFQTKDGMNKYKIVGFGYAVGPNVDHSKEPITFDPIFQKRPLEVGDILVSCEE